MKKPQANTFALPPRRAAAKPLPVVRPAPVPFFSTLPPRMLVATYACFIFAMVAVYAVEHSANPESSAVLALVLALLWLGAVGVLLTFVLALVAMLTRQHVSHNALVMLALFLPVILLMLGAAGS